MNSGYRILRDRSQITSHGRGKSKKSLTGSDLKSGGGGERSPWLFLRYKKMPLNDRRNASRTILSSSDIICERFPARLS